MATATDQFLMFAAVFVLAYIAHRIWRYFFPDGPAEQYGYAPGTEDPPWGWPLTILGTIAVIAIFIGLFGYVGSAVFLG